MSKRLNKKQARYNQSAFLFNVKDWFLETADMSAQEKGYYIDLLCIQWEKGHIPNDPRRLWAAVGKGDPFDTDDMAAFVSRYVPRNVNVTVDTSGANFKTFLECWQFLKTKFLVTPSGNLMNMRLEEERQHSLEHIDSQKARTAAATKARVEKARNEHRYDSRNVDRNEHRYDSRNVDRNEDISKDVTTTNSNPNSNTDIKKNTRAEEKPEFGKNREDQDQLWYTPREFSILRGESSPLRLHLYLGQDFLCQEITKLLNSNLDTLLMHQNICQLPDDYQSLIFENYFKEKIAEGQEYTSAVLRRGFIWWYNNSMYRLERQYNDSKKTKQWFEAELIKTNGACKSEEAKREFVEYYLAITPSGKHYFQTLTNFNVADSLKKWVKSDYKTMSKIKSDTGGIVIPKEGETIEDIRKKYKPE